ncbi:MAG: autoinducer binding domain-containing protein [Nitrospiraceae bacterium]|nr:autoinducer binding domain-containing protein [Nitrospiraceae bacterium]
MRKGSPTPTSSSSSPNAPRLPQANSAWTEPQNETDAPRFPLQAFTDFSKTELLNFMEVFHYAFHAKTESEVTTLLQLTQRHIPCRAMIAGILTVDPAMPSPGFHKIVNVSYPTDWIMLYLKNRYAGVDPVLRQHIRSGGKTQAWTNTYQRNPSLKGQEFVEEARAFGLSTGVTIGEADSAQGLTSFVSFADDKEPVPTRYHAALSYLSRYLHGAIMRITPPVIAPAGSDLSPREQTVLDWMRHGKTNWEISRILGVSERTIRFHAESIFHKLDVSSRTQAVAYAVEKGLLARR